MRITSHVSIESDYSNADSGKVSQFQISDLTNVSGTPTLVQEWGEGVTAYLIHLRIEKNIYKPNRLEGIIMTNSTDRSLPDVIANTLIEGRITVWQENGDQKMYIAQNYLIHEVNPEVRTMDYNFVKVQFVAYSPDVMLTYDKYSMAYTTRRLCKDIIPSQLGGTLSSVYSADDFVTDTLQNTSLNNKEIVIPYLMQYNESFYDFLRRVTYRSGEYMYYEGGKLHVGMTEPADSDIPVVKYIMKQSKLRHSMRYSTKAIMPHSSNVNAAKDAVVYADSPSYNEEFSQEEYALMLKRDPNVDKWAKKATTWTGLVIDILSQNSVFDAIKTGAKDVLNGKLTSMKTTKDNNSKFNETNKFSVADKGGKGDFYDIDKDSATKYTPYMMFYSVNQLMANAYHEIRKGEDVVASGMQHIQLHPELYTHLILGEVIRLEESGTEYVVVRIDRTEDADARDHVKVSYFADVVPLLYEGIRILPPHQDDIETVRRVGPQHAYVVSNTDPGNLGRMTVRFHWQTETGDASLPLRQSQQMASADSGFRFQPEIGDEVIVNFTNGNADLPYVAGALYNKAHTTPSSVRTIRSFHGHSITFDDSGDDTAFRKALLPMWGTVENWINLEKNDKLATLKEKLKTATDDCKAALKDLKGDKTDASLEKYQTLCDAYAYRKTFHDKAMNVTLGNNVYSDDEIMNKRYELQYARTGDTISKVEGDDSSQQNVVDNAISTVDTALNNAGKAITASAKDTNVARVAYAAQVVKYKQKLQDNFDKLGIIASAVADTASSSSSSSSDSSSNITMTPLYTYSEADGSNKLYALRTEIKRKQQSKKDAQAKLDDLKAQKDNGVEKVGDKSIDDAIAAQQIVVNAIDNYINKTDAFLKDAMAIPESDVVSDAASDDMRYDTYKQKEHDKYTKASTTDKTQWLPSDQELANVTTKKGKIEQLQYLIDQETTSNVCQDIYQPDSSYTNQSDKYQKFCSTYKEMKEIKAAYDQVNTPTPKTDLTYHTGGITIADDAGLYSMKFDATKRAISMSCPLGSVTMNALTGITISAPNGDVKIAGKNISIVAGNNITLDAGGNRTIVEKSKKAQKALLTSIKNTFTDPKVALEETKDLAIDTFKGVFDDTVSTALSLIPEQYRNAAPAVPVDMTALRCVYECLIKPVEGTVKLHTTNNILLEAGGGKTSVDMSSIKSKYNQRQVDGNRSASIAYTVKSLNDLFDEIYALAKSAPSSQKKASDDLRKYIWTVSKAKDGTTQSGIWKGLKANWSKEGDDDAAKIINGIIESEKGRDPEKDGDLTLEREQVYQTPSGGKSLSDLEAASKKKVRTRPQGDDEAVLFRSVHDAEAALKEIDKAKGLIEALSKVLANPGFKDKGKEIAKYPTVLLKDLGVDKTMYKDIGKEVQEYTIVHKGGTMCTMCDDKPVTAESLLKTKRKYFMQIITKMTEGESSAVGSFIKTALFGSSPADFAYVNNETGTLPPMVGDALANTKAWNSMVDLLKATSTDKNKVASFINEHITSPISKTLGIANVISFVGNVHGLMDEYSAQSVEAQGQIYMTSKGGKSTVKLKDKQFVESATYSSKFEDIQTYLKAEITEPKAGAEGPTLLDLKLFS